MTNPWKYNIPGLVVNQIIERTAPEKPTLTEIPQLQYIGAKLITIEIANHKTKTKSGSNNREHRWKWRLQKQIDLLWGESGIITEYKKGNISNKVIKKIKTIGKKYKIKIEENNQLVVCREDINQTIQAKAQILQRSIFKKMQSV